MLSEFEKGLACFGEIYCSCPDVRKKRRCAISGPVIRTRLRAPRKRGCPCPTLPFARPLE